MATKTKAKIPAPQITQLNQVGLPRPTMDELKEGIVYCYGLKPVGQLYRAVIVKLKGDQVVERIENLETTRALQVGHIARAMDAPGFGRG